MRYGLMCCILAAIWPAAASLAAEAKRPNVIILFADDLGYGELGMQGNREIPTPHIDSIAANGIRFTQGYVAATYCSPSRAGLLTGRYPTRFGHEFNGRGPEFGLPLTEVTLADRLRSAGYSTACVGKWHLGDQVGKNDPTKRGFDEFYGTLANTPFFHPLLVDSRIDPAPKKVEDAAFYTTDAYADRAVDWLDKQKGKPFFLYLPFNAQHAPLEATEKYLSRFGHITDEKRRIFAAMMSAMDDAVGRVLAKVREMGEEENTLIWYLADNGGPTKSTTSKNDPLRGYKMTTLEGGTRVPFCVQWKGKLPAGKVYAEPIIQLDIAPTTLAAIGVAIPAEAKYDGLDLLPYITGKISSRPHETLYWRYGEQFAVRHGDWKLVRSSLDGPTPQLFNLAEDIGEAKDLSAAHPEKVQELTALWKAWNAEQAAAAWGGNEGQPKKKKKAQSKAKAAAAP